MFMPLFAVLLLFVWSVVKEGARSKPKALPEVLPSSSTDTENASGDFVGTALSETTSEADGRTSEDATESATSEGDEPTESTSVPVAIPSACLTFDGQDDDVRLGKQPAFEPGPVLTPTASEPLEPAEAPLDLSRTDAEPPLAASPGQTALQFDGSNYIEIDDPFQNNTAFTISLWVKPAVLNDGWLGIIGKQGDGYRKPGLSVRPSNNGLHYDSNAPNGQRYYGLFDNFFMAPDQWVHVSWVKDGTTYRLYRNGELFATETAPEHVFTAATSYWIGQVNTFFIGQLADVRMWSRVRSEDEIQADMNRRLSGTEAGLSGYWQLNEGTGDTAKDLSGIGNDGTIHGATWVESDVPLADAPVVQLPVEPKPLADAPVVQLPVEPKPLADAPVAQLPAESKPLADAPVVQLPVEPKPLADAPVVQLPVEQNYTLEFDGRRGCVAVDNLHYNSQGQIRAITIEAWVKTNKTSQGIVASWDRSEYWRLAIGNNVNQPQQRVFWATTNETRQVDDFVGQRLVADGDWHFITAVYESGTGAKRIYVDGELDREKTAHNGRNLGTGATRYGFIGVGSEANTFNGRKSPAAYFQGQIDEIRIWDRVCSEAEIKANMNRQLAGNEDGLVGYWRFNEGTGDTVTDQSGNGNDGTICGARWVEFDALA